MKKLLYVFPAVLVFAIIAAPNAHADSYVPTFTCSPFAPACPLAFPIASDVSFPAPTDIVVNVQDAPVGPFSAVFDMSLAAGDSPADTYDWSYTATPPGGVTQYAWLTLTDDTTGLIDTVMITSPPLNTLSAPFPGFPFPGDPDGGGLTFSPVSAATPEPSSVLLMLLGAGLIFLMRKRFNMRLPRTA